IHTINESAPEFKLCIDDILYRIKNMGLVVDSNEAMRCNIIGEENTGCVDYAIKKIISEMLEEIICITEGNYRWIVLPVTILKKIEVFVAVFASAWQDARSTGNQ
ncbi:16011_t:CDS:2, partial [Funneliformis mosseae]